MNGKTIPMVQKRLEKAYKRLHSWQKVGVEFGVTKGTAYRVAHGYDPKDPHIRQALNLPALAPAPVCHRCGVVHVAKRCTAKRVLPEPYEEILLWLEARMKVRYK